MNERNKILISLTLVIVMALITIGIQDTTRLQAESSEEVKFYLPAVFSPFAPQLEPFVTEIVPPNIITDIVDPGDGRFFIATRDGRIQISLPDGSVAPDLLLDIRDKVYDDGNEMGLIGLTTHPDFAENGYIYVSYMEEIENIYYYVLARYHVGLDNQADPTTEQRILHFQQPTSRHNGGDLHFGPLDGYLYITVGDGGTGGDFGGYAQSTETLLGKILRIDVNDGSPYSIPTDNPFISDGNSRAEIWALGFRNPWRMSFDRETGDIYIGDVGESTWEEVNFIPAGSGGGENFGWPCMEGPDVFRPDVCEAEKTYVAPIFSFRHEEGSCASIIGGYVYRGSQVKEIAGHYLLGNLCGGKLWSLIPDGEEGWSVKDWGLTNKTITTFGERHDGELFIGAKDIYQIVGQKDLN
jgi:glucose/arabinose dehydrogenase